MRSVGKERFVYSTDSGRICTYCGKPVDTCVCKAKKKAKITGDGAVRVMFSTKGRKGKGVTIVSGLPVTAADLNALAKELRKKCGSGGTVKNGTIEIQGDHCDLVLQELQERGWKPKRSGG